MIAANTASEGDEEVDRLFLDSVDRERITAWKTRMMQLVRSCNDKVVPNCAKLLENAHDATGPLLQ